MDQPQSFGDFDHGSHPATAGRNQVNLPFSYYRSKGTTSLPRWRRGTTVHQGERLVRSQAGRSTSCAFCLSILLHHVNPKGRRAYSPFNRTTMEPLPHGLLVLSSSKPLTGRTGLQTEGRFSLLELHWRHHYSLVYRNTPPDKDSSHDDMPCRTPLH